MTAARSDDQDIPTRLAVIESQVQQLREDRSVPALWTVLGEIHKDTAAIREDVTEIKGAVAAHGTQIAAIIEQLSTQGEQLTAILARLPE